MILILRDSPLVSGAQPVKTDILFVEGTYGGRDHPPKEEEIGRFIQAVSEVVRRGGTVLIPAFANGRTQDVVMLLHEHLPQLNVHVDGMGKRVARIHLEHPSYLRDSNALERAWRWVKRAEQIGQEKSTCCRRHRDHLRHVERWSSTLVPQPPTQ